MLRASCKSSKYSWIEAKLAIVSNTFASKRTLE
jgi:hypothetical protein